MSNEEAYAAFDDSMPDPDDRETYKQKRLREKLLINRTLERKYAPGHELEQLEMKAYQHFMRRNPTSQLSFLDFQSQERAVNRREPAMKHKKNACWKSEKNRKPRETVQGNRFGFGSWYKQDYHDYTRAEFEAPQTSADRVRTKDCKPMDQINRDEHDDDSHCDSDWFDRTGHERFYKRVPREPSKR